MRATNKENTGVTSHRQKPAYNPDARENQMIALAVDLAEKQLREGTASSQVITHYLKLGTQKEKKELEILEKQKELMDAKTESLKSAANIEKLYAEAIKSMKSYSGIEEDEEGDDDDDEEFYEE